MTSISVNRKVWEAAEMLIHEIGTLALNLVEDETGRATLLPGELARWQAAMGVYYKAVKASKASKVDKGEQLPLELAA